MAATVTLALYAPLLAAAAAAVWRRPARALYAFVVGLALHNLVMAELWELGVRGLALDAVAAWKEALLAVALAAVVRARGVPYAGTWPDRLAAAYGAAVALYAVIPQDWLGGAATGKGILLGLRHDALVVAAYFLGRGLALARDDLRRIAVTVVATAAGLAVAGLVDVYAVPLDWWRDSGAPGWYEEQLGLEYEGLSGLPENFVYNDGDETPLRRLVSTFLSPLASSYLLVVALLYLAARPFARWVPAAAAVLAAGLLFTYSRSALVALAGALVVLALALRRAWPVAAAAALVAVGAAFVQVYPEIGPETRFTPAELEYQREHAAKEGGDASHDPFSASEPSLASHWTSLRDGVETVLEHPQGYGLGNAGTTASRTDVELQAGESTYTELGVDAGLLGLALFVAWSLVLLWWLLRRSPWLAASLAAILALGIQTDVIGVPWLAYVLWTLAGSAVSSRGRMIA